MSSKETHGPYKILIVSPQFGYSHMNFFGRIADALVEAGHDVVIFRPVISEETPRVDSKARIIHTKLIQDTLPQMRMITNPEVQRPIWTASATSPMGILRFLPFVKSITTKAVSSVLNETEILQQLKREKFDVAITELYEYIGIAVIEALGIKNVIGAHSNGCILEDTALAIGRPVIPSYMPASLGVTDDSSSLLTRATNVLFSCLSWYQQKVLSSAAERVMKEKLGPTITPVWETISNMNWVLSNSEPLFDFPKPTIHNIVDVGGIGVSKPQPLSRKWNKVLSSRPTTILISFGTVIPSMYMPKEMKKAMLSAISVYPDITFIWKYEQPDDPLIKDVGNLVASEWIPQNDLLADDRLSLFITHGGSGSLLEAATYGKPMIVVPLFGDQTRNAKLAEKFGIAFILEKTLLLKSTSICEAIDEVLYNERYRKSGLRMRGMLLRRVISPKDKLIKTVELAAEFGAIPELLLSGRKLSFITYYNLDLFALLVLFLSLLIFVVLCSASCTCRYFLSG